MTAQYEYVGRELPLFGLAAHWKRYVARLTLPYVRGRVLEVGAGSGNSTRALWNPRVTDWLCLEPDENLARPIASIQLGAGGANPRLRAGTTADLAIGERFDTIVYMDVLEHIADDRAELSRACGHLEAGGTIIVLSPAFPLAFSAFDRAVGHQRRYLRRTLADRFPAGLRRISVRYVDAFGLALSLANRFVLRRSQPSARQVLFWDRVVVPLSQLVDPITAYAFGRSVLAIYEMPS
jgi:SAM-dependent methyltransferase